MKAKSSYKRKAAIPKGYNKAYDEMHGENTKPRGIAKKTNKIYPKKTFRKK